VNVQERLELGQKDRPVDALLAAYAAGTLSTPMAVLVAARLDLKPADRSFVAAMEAAYGVLLDDIEPVPLASRDRCLVNIFSGEDPSDRLVMVPKPQQRLNGHAGGSTNGRDRSAETLPGSLRRFIGRDLEDLEWRSVSSGIKQSVIISGTSEEASLIRWRAGHRTPSHGHHGFEAMLVLKGGFSDGIGEYRRGDVSVADETVEHKPIALPGEDCIVYSVREAPVKTPGAVNRVIQMLLGRSE
jgi:putative transcriptional regulator